MLRVKAVGRGRIGTRCVGALALVVAGCTPAADGGDAGATVDAAVPRCTDLAAIYAVDCPLSTDSDRTTLLAMCQAATGVDVCVAERDELLSCLSAELRGLDGAVCAASVLQTICVGEADALFDCRDALVDAGPPARCSGVGAAAGEVRVETSTGPVSFPLPGCELTGSFARVHAIRPTGSEIDLSFDSAGAGSQFIGSADGLYVTLTSVTGADSRTCTNEVGDLCNLCTAFEAGVLVGTIECARLTCDDGTSTLPLTASFRCPSP